jgi:single-strand DNA-binding protein
MLNKIIVIGNLGRDPELSYTQSGAAVTKFSVAVNRRSRDKQTGESKEETQWFNVVAWERLAETCNQYLHKGSKVYVEGRMTSRKYTDRDGIERTVWEVVLNDMQMLNPKDAGNGSGSAGTGVGAARGAGSSGSAGDEWGDVTADDVPF